jgi:uncharacterized protein
MQVLDYLYENTIPSIEFKERKLKITKKNTIIIGPPKCGKTYLIYDYLSNLKSNEYLYIDLLDIRYQLKNIELYINKFINNNGIKNLVIENYNDKFILPNCDNIILSSINNINIDKFNTIYLSALDFEEHISHDTKNQNIKNSFNTFFKYGNLPELINIQENNKIKRTQEILKLFTKNDTNLSILMILIQNIDEKKSLHELYNKLKQNIKISKDKFYALSQEYSNNNIIFFINKYSQEKAAKKIYTYNHSLISSISYHKRFKQEFTNMVFLELKNRFNEIYYLDNIDFYIPNKRYLILCIPFLNDNILNKITKKILNIIIEYDIKNVSIITISNSKILYLQNREIEIIPFYEWSLS